MIIYAILVGVCSIFLIISPLLRFRPSIQYNVQFFSCLFIIGGGIRIVEEVLKTSWLNSLIIATIYSIAVIILTKIVHNISSKKASQN